MFDGSDTVFSWKGFGTLVGFGLWLGGGADMFGCEFDETTKMAGGFKLYVIGSDG